MKSALFFILSLGLHAALLLYPVAVYGPHGDQLIAVRLLPTHLEVNDGGGQTANAHPAPPAGSKSQGSAARRIEPRTETRRDDYAAPQAVAGDAVAKASEIGTVPVSTITSFTEKSGAALSGSSGNETDGYGKQGSGGRGNVAFGTGSGSGNGAGSSGNGIAFTQARYREAPRPQYPEHARREGRQGRVLLRVLVDAEGKPITVEVNRSSGSESLDRAAADAVRRWHFSPARKGDTPVESWVRIPVDFQLTDPGDR